MKYTARLPDNNANVTPTSPLREFFILTGGLLGVVAGIYFLLGLAVNLIVPGLSPEVEKKMAPLFIGVMEKTRDPSEHAGAVQALLDDLQGRCARLPYDFKAHLFENETANALALPGGHIVLFTGLIETVTSENELMFVLAHELGHYAHRDHLHGVGRALVFMIASTLLFGPDSSIGSMLGSALNVTELRFSRKQETRADEFAVEMLDCLYGHVGGATDFFDKISKEENPSVFGHYFATHPENRRRMEHVAAHAENSGFKSHATRPVPTGLAAGARNRQAGPKPSGGIHD